MIVDCHAHLVPPDLLAAIRKEAAKFPNVRQIEDGGALALRVCRRQADAAGVRSRCRILPARVAWMAQARHRQAGGRRLGRHVRLRVAGRRRRSLGAARQRRTARTPPRPSRASCRSPPCRCSDGARAAAVLKDAMKAGFAGAMIGTLPRGVGSDARSRRPRSVLAGRRRDRRAHSYPSELRRRRRARQRFRPRQRRSAASPTRRSRWRG